MKQPDRLSRSVFWLAITVVCLVIPGCGPLTRSNAVPVAAEKQAVVLELPEARYWGDGDPAAFRQAMVEAFFREQALFRAAGNSGDLPRAEFLAISGGGEDGAFGAGLLVGWTATGTRPVFKAVTGISTGALTAPFAFLGSAYDDKLKQVYTLLRSEPETDQGR